MDASPVAELPAARGSKAAPGRRPLYSAALISFSLTFVGAGLAVLAGYLPTQLALLDGRIDAEVVLLFVPLAALVFAIVAEAARISFRGTPRAGAPRRASPLGDWTPGHGEG